MLLYIHIPFCDSKCHYCSFNSYVDKLSLRKHYMEALVKQLRYELQRFETAPKAIETMFIGGGTPSTIAPHLYAPLFETVKPYLKQDAEITSEANPNSATESWLKGMEELGVNRISFGVQSFDDKKLKRLGRAHNSHDARTALWHAKEAGFEHLSVDLIYGVESDTMKLLEYDLEEAFSLPIDHLSAYALTIEEGTPFASSPEMADEKLELTKWLFENITRKGFSQYEISNFGSYRSLHNMGYWQYKNYIGLGSGAVGFKDNMRFYPDLHIENYIDNPLNIKTEALSKEEIKTEKIFLGLRSCVGIDKNILTPHEHKRAMMLVDEEKLLYRDRHFFNQDYLLSDEIALFIEN